LAQHYAATGFSARDYTARWSSFPVGPLTTVVRNWPARGRALSLHDVHHALTGYDTSIKGEALLGAYEIATGCGRHWIGWVLQTEIFAYGLTFAPLALWQAFLRGRHAGTLYARPYADEALLARPVDAVRRELKLDRPTPPATWRDRLAFSAWALVSLPRLVLSAAFTATFGVLIWLALHLWYRLEGQRADAFELTEGL
jgi:hypothetical protein